MAKSFRDYYMGCLLLIIGVKGLVFYCVECISAVRLLDNYASSNDELWLFLENFYKRQFTSLPKISLLKQLFAFMIHVISLLFTPPISLPQESLTPTFFHQFPKFILLVIWSSNPSKNLKLTRKKPQPTTTTNSIFLIIVLLCYKEPTKSSNLFIEHETRSNNSLHKINYPFSITVLRVLLGLLCS